VPVNEFLRFGLDDSPVRPEQYYTRGGRGRVPRTLKFASGCEPLRLEAPRAQRT